MSDNLREDKNDKKGLKKGSLIIGVSLAVAVLVLVAVVFFLLKATNIATPAALVIGGREVSKEQFDEYVELGKKTNTPVAIVKQQVIDYEKNKISAEKHDLKISQAYVELSRQDLLVSASEIGGSIETLRTADDDFTKLRLYNVAFRSFVQISGDDGWGIVLYDIPVIPSNDEAESVNRAQAVAKKLHAQLEDKSIGTVKGIEKAQQENIGQPAQTGLYFIRKSDGAVLSQYGGGIYTRLLDPAFMLPYLKDKKPGLTAVQDFNKQSAFFVDVMYEQKKRDNLAEIISKEKSEIRVVDYVN